MGAHWSGWKLKVANLIQWDRKFDMLAGRPVAGACHPNRFACIHERFIAYEWTKVHSPITGSPIVTVNCWVPPPRTKEA